MATPASSLCDDGKPGAPERERLRGGRAGTRDGGPPRGGPLLMEIRLSPAAGVRSKRRDVWSPGDERAERAIVNAIRAARQIRDVAEEDRRERRERRELYVDPLDERHYLYGIPQGGTTAARWPGPLAAVCSTI